MGRGTHAYASARVIEIARRRLAARGIEVGEVFQRPEKDEPVPCLVCGRSIIGKLVCGNCKNAGWRDRTCSSCGQHQIHARDYDSGPYRSDRILKCQWCRKTDREGPDPWAP